MKMRVLWFSNCSLAASESNGSGSWLYAMSNLMRDKIELYNITEANVNEVEYKEANGIKEYILPLFKLKHGIPSSNKITLIKKLVDSIAPDVIHIWGLEKYWALLFSRKFLEYVPIIEIQGLLSSCFDVYWGGMTPMEILSTIKIKEILKPSSSLMCRKNNLGNKAKYENEVLSCFDVFSTQSQWTRDQLKSIAPTAITYNTKRPIRKEFWMANKWSVEKENTNYIIFTSISYYEPFKGIHILLKAINELVKRNKNVILKIAGPNLTTISNIRLGGYERCLLTYINENHLSEHIVFLGKLNSSSIVSELQSAHVFVNSSFVESFSASTAEALCLGVPSVISFAGAMPEFNLKRDTILCYSPSDYKSCAAHIEKIISSPILQRNLSINSISAINALSSNDVVVATQLEIYRDHLKSICK